MTQALVEQANQLLQRGELPDALILLEQNPRDTQLLVLFREWYIGERQNELAMPMVEQLANDHGGEAHVSRSIYALLNGDLRMAAQEAQTAVKVDPQLATAHNHLGRALHNMGQTNQALQAFQNATRLQEDYPQAWQNIGHVMRASGQMDEAMKAYRQALVIAPGYQGAMLNLGITLSLVEDAKGALDCFQSILDTNPKHVEALVNAGLSQHLLGQMSEAEASYQRALEMDSSNATAWCFLGILLNEQMNSQGAIDALQRALKLNPQDMEARVELARVHEQNNRLEQARELVDEGQKMDPYHPSLRLEHAKLERRAGNIASGLKTLRSLDVRQLPPRMALQYHFELGQALDRHGEFDEAYAAFTASNEMQARSPRRASIDVDGFSTRAEKMRQWLSRGAPGAKSQSGENEGDTGRDLCFLLGFPRSGTTLLDTFLNAHPDITSIEERPTLERVIDELRLQPGGYPDGLEDLPAQEVIRLRAYYRDEISHYVGSAGSGIVLDKLPLRTLNAALIHRLFPDARILLALRHPCDVVMSNFMQQYAENEAFIHFDNLAESAGMYDTVMGIWQSCQSVLDMNSASTRYEDLVADPEAELARVCHFLGLQVHPAMMDAQTRLDSRARIRTPSYQQVAEPVYQRAAGRWENYREYFTGVLPLLSPYVEAFGYGQDDEDS